MIGDKLRIFFRDTEGKEYFDKDIIKHNNLAKKIIEADEKLNEKFKQSGIKNETEFLIREGYLVGTEIEDGYNEILYMPSKVSQKGKKLLLAFLEEGYKLYDLEKERQDKQKEEQGR